MKTNNETPSPQPNVRVAADAYLAEQGFEHSGGIIERAFEAGASWAVKVERERCLDIVDEWYGGGRSFVMRKISSAAATSAP